MKALSRSEGSLKWLFFACLLAIAMGVGFMGFNQWTTTQDKYTAQANQETLAKDIVMVCSTQGKLVVDNRDLCDKGADVLENPTAAIAGPKGEPGLTGDNGKDGADSTVPGPAGKDGKDGLNGADSTVPGPAGKDGTDGQNGADSTVPGPPGGPGADSTVPGPQGEQGKQGEPGQSPSSFTWTDSKTGTKYTCVPDPVGSSTYSCTEEPKPIPVT